MSLTHKMFGKCFECNRMFAMKKHGKELVRTEDSNAAEVLYQMNIKGEMQTMGERFAAGERKTYETTYVCRFCGAKHTKFTYRYIKK